MTIFQLPSVLPILHSVIKITELDTGTLLQLTSQ